MAKDVLFKNQKKVVLTKEQNDQKRHLLNVINNAANDHLYHGGEIKLSNIKKPPTSMEVESAVKKYFEGRFEITFLKESTLVIKDIRVKMKNPFAARNLSVEEARRRRQQEEATY